MKFLYRFLFMSGMVAFASTTVKAQSSWANRNFAGAAQIQVGYRNTDLGELNTILNRNNIPSLKGNDIWLGLSMSHIKNNWVFEDGVAITPTSSSEGNNRVKARVGQAQLFLRAGYNVLKNENMRFYPFAGVNLTGSMLRLQDKNRQDLTSDFSQTILNSTASKTLYQGNFGIDLGAGYDYLIKIKSKTTDCFTVDRYIPIGLRAGYYINAARSDWKVDDHELNNSPKITKGSAFVTLVVGLGYNIKKTQ